MQATMWGTEVRWLVATAALMVALGGCGSKEPTEPYASLIKPKEMSEADWLYRKAVCNRVAAAGDCPLQDDAVDAAVRNINATEAEIREQEERTSKPQQRTAATSLSPDETILLMRSAATESVKASARDPSSVRFRNVRTNPVEGHQAVCGEFNAKNGFGGYAGFERFIYGGKLGTVTAADMEAGQFDQAWNLLCGR